MLSVNLPKSKIIVILGPTASGKTALAIQLAKKFNGEVISADSRQIYRGMDIATGKPKTYQKSPKDSLRDPTGQAKIKNKKYEINNVKHHLFDIINPDQDFSAAEYKELAVEKIKEIQARGKLPFLVGGTGLYIKTVVDNLDIPRVPANKKLRMELEQKTTEELAKLIGQKDPVTAKTIDVKNRRRLIRALEVIIATGNPFSAQRNKGKPLFDALQLGIDLARPELYRRIDERVEEMIKNGLVEETKILLKKYIPSLPSMSGIGYKEIGEYLNGKMTLEEAKQKIKNRTHAYVRRQLTWFRKNKKIGWIKNKTEAGNLIADFLTDKAPRNKDFA